MAQREESESGIDSELQEWLEALADIYRFRGEPGVNAILDGLVISSEHEDELHVRASLVACHVEHIAGNVVGTTDSVALRIWP